MVKNKKENKADELLKRVFKVIAGSHFKDFKLSPFYVDDILFKDRGLGEDIAEWIRNYHPDYYNHKKVRYC